MEVVDARLLAGWQLALVLQLALAAATLSASAAHVLRALPAGCRAAVRLLPASCWEAGCAASAGSVAAGCAGRLGAVEAALLLELWAAVALAAVELAALLTGLHGGTAGGRTLGVLGALGHAAGCCAGALFLVSGASATDYHALFVCGSLLPFGCHAASWLQLARGARPWPRFPPPEADSDRMASSEGSSMKDGLEQPSAAPPQGARLGSAAAFVDSRLAQAELRLGRLEAEALQARDARQRAGADPAAADAVLARLGAELEQLGRGRGRLAALLGGAAGREDPEGSWGAVAQRAERLRARLEQARLLVSPAS